MTQYLEKLKTVADLTSEPPVSEGHGATAPLVEGEAGMLGSPDPHESSVPRMLTPEELLAERDARRALIEVYGTANLSRVHKQQSRERARARAAQLRLARQADPNQY